jgi:cobalt-precorrin 5A hydrolase
MIAAGIGCRTGCDGAAIAALVRAAEHGSGLVAATLAVPHFKAAEPGIAVAAGLLGLGITVIEGGAMAAMQAFCVTRSALAMEHTGLASVAEAAALAAVGRKAVLRVARIAGGGATCALAEGTGE